ncbi:MAG TPA: hypothetical protein VL418_13250 [Devosiaceae bacterium]|jgi:hypothetical protein|nr:hypothetical protein [Devosiaceae bacterium]
MRQSRTEDQLLRSDDDLIGLLESGPWIVRAGPQPAASRVSLREALEQARALSAQGLAITHLERMPNEIVIGAVQVFRLWQKLGMISPR